MKCPSLLQFLVTNPFLFDFLPDLQWCKAPDQTLPAPDLVVYLEECGWVREDWVLAFAFVSGIGKALILPLMLICAPETLELSHLKTCYSPV